MPVYPTADKWFCNEFVQIDDDVIGIEIQYAKRAFVEPPVATRWFYLNTASQIAVTFDSLGDLHDHCDSLGHTSFPEFVRKTSNTTKL